MVVVLEERLVSDGLQGLRVLVVEDEYLLAAEMEDTIRDLGAEVAGPFGRLDVAMAALRDQKIDGAVLDVRLDGHFVSDLVLALIAREVPIVLTTGLTQEDMPEPLRGLPCLRKPYDPRALERLVQRSFRGS